MAQIDLGLGLFVRRAIGGGPSRRIGDGGSFGKTYHRCWRWREDGKGRSGGETRPGDVSLGGCGFFVALGPAAFCWGGDCASVLRLCQPPMPPPPPERRIMPPPPHAAVTGTAE